MSLRHVFRYTEKNLTSVEFHVYLDRIKIVKCFLDSYVTSPCSQDLPIGIKTGTISCYKIYLTTSNYFPRIKVPYRTTGRYKTNLKCTSNYQLHKENMHNQTYESKFSFNRRRSDPYWHVL